MCREMHDDFGKSFRQAVLFGSWEHLFFVPYQTVTEARAGRFEGVRRAACRTAQTHLRCSLFWGVTEAAKALKGNEEPIGRKTGRFGCGWQKRS